MSDLISRQAAIDALTEYGNGRAVFISVGEAVIRIEQLPPAQPEPCEDAVSREKVKELAYSQIRSEYSGIALKEQREAMLRIADNVIGLLPSVTPKQRTGKWIKTARWRNVYKCDQCGNYLDFSGVNAGRGDANFCPNCGSRNEVTE